MSTPPVYCPLRDEFLLMVWWPEEKAKRVKLWLESENYPYLQSLVDDAERMSMRLRVEVMHPHMREKLEMQLLVFSWDIGSVGVVSDLLVLFRVGDSGRDLAMQFTHERYRESSLKRHSTLNDTIQSSASCAIHLSG